RPLQRSAPADRAGMLAHDVGRAERDERARRGDEDDHVVDLADDGQHLGNEVERPDDVRDRAEEQRLRPDGYARIAQESPVEPYEAREMEQDVDLPGAPGEHGRARSHAPSIPGVPGLAN